MFNRLFYKFKNLNGEELPPPPSAVENTPVEFVGVVKEDKPKPKNKAQPKINKAFVMFTSGVKRDVYEGGIIKVQSCGNHGVINIVCITRINGYLQNTPTIKWINSEYCHDIVQTTIKFDPKYFSVTNWDTMTCKEKG